MFISKINQGNLDSEQNKNISIFFSYIYVNTFYF